MEDLSLNGCVAVRDVSCLAACRDLRTLDLLGCRAVTDVRALGQCEHLWKLDLRGTAYTHDRRPAPKLPSVRELRGPGWQELDPLSLGRVL